MLVDDYNKKCLFYGSTLQKSIRGDPPCTVIVSSPPENINLEFIRQLSSILLDSALISARFIVFGGIVFASLVSICFTNLLSCLVAFLKGDRIELQARWKTFV